MKNPSTLRRIMVTSAVNIPQSRPSNLGQRSLPPRPWAKCSAKIERIRYWRLTFVMRSSNIRILNQYAILGLQTYSAAMENEQRLCRKLATQVGSEKLDKPRDRHDHASVSASYSDATTTSLFLNLHLTETKNQ